MIGFFTLVLIAYARLPRHDRNHMFSTDQKRSIANNLVQTKWTPNLDSAWARPQSKSDFALQILSRRSQNNAVSREDFLKRLVEIEGLNSGHFTANKKVEELVAPFEGLTLESVIEEIDERAWEAGNEKEKVSHEEKALVKDFTSIIDVEEYVKAHGYVKERRYDEKPNVGFDELNEGKAISRMSSTPYWAFIVGPLMTCVVCMFFAVTKGRVVSVSRPHSEAEVDDVWKISGHHKYP